MIGVDMNDDMLALARKYQPHMAAKLGNERVRFIKGWIQDLALDCEAMEAYLAAHPVKTPVDTDALLAWQAQQRQLHPVIADSSMDLVISNCVLNLVGDDDKQQMVREIHRVLKPGGRVEVPKPDWTASIAGRKPSLHHCHRVRKYSDKVILMEY